MKKILLFVLIAIIVLALAIGISYKIAYNNATKDDDKSTVNTQNVDNETSQEVYGGSKKEVSEYHIDGTYVSESSYETESLTYVFDGDRVYFGGLSEQEGSYTIEGDKIIIRYDVAYDPEGNEVEDFPYGESEEVAIIDDDTLESTTEGISTTYKRDMSSVADGIVLYKGFDITGYKPGKVYIANDMDFTDKNREKYEIEYYSYEQGKYIGKSTGKFEETYQDVGVVTNTEKIALSRNYNAVPREIKTLSKVPSSLNLEDDYTKVTVLSVDLDGDNREEKLVIYQKDIKAEAEDDEPLAISGIDFYDSSYEKIANLVNLNDGFWLDETDDSNKFLYTTEYIDFADIDADGIIEVIVDIPFWEACGLSIYKWDGDSLAGETNYTPILSP